MANIVNNWCSSIVTIASDVIRNYEKNEEEIKRIEGELTDINHEIELAAAKDMYKGWQMYKLIREFLLYKNYYNFLNYLSTLEFHC